MTPVKRSASVRAVVVVVVVVLVAAIAFVAARASSTSTPAAEEGGKVVGTQAPAPVDLSTPERSVRSYLGWTTFAYRMANSDLASKAVEPTEGVRVDSYIEYNKQNGNKAIDQYLTSFKVTKQTVKGDRATVSTSETWVYRYFSLDTQRYISPKHTTRYDVTYSVVKLKGGWLVDKVDAKALDKVY